MRDRVGLARPERAMPGGSGRAVPRPAPRHALAEASREGNSSDKQGEGRDGYRSSGGSAARRGVGELGRGEERRERAGW